MIPQPPSRLQVAPVGYSPRAESPQHFKDLKDEMMIVMGGRDARRQAIEEKVTSILDRLGQKDQPAAWDHGACVFFQLCTDFFGHSTMHGPQNWFLGTAGMSEGRADDLLPPGPDIAHLLDVPLSGGLATCYCFICCSR